MDTEIIVALCGLFVAVVGSITAFIQWRGKLAAEKLQAESDRERQNSDLELARVNAQRESEASDDAITQRFIDMLEMVLNRQHDKFAELAQTFKAGMTEVAQGVQRSFDASLAHMTAVSRDRDAWQTAMDKTVADIPSATERQLHASFKQIPDETRDSLAPRLDTLQGVIIGAIDDLEQRMIARTNPQAENWQDVIRRDLGGLKTDCQTVFTRLAEMQEMLQRMEPKPPNTPTPFVAIPGQGGKPKDDDKTDDLPLAAGE